jgi:hypothetical protein
MQHLAQLTAPFQSACASVGKLPRRLTTACLLSCSCQLRRPLQRMHSTEPRTRLHRSAVLLSLRHDTEHNHGLCSISTGTAVWITAGCTLPQDVQHHETEHTQHADTTEQPPLQQGNEEIQAQLQVCFKAHDMLADARSVQMDVRQGL